MGLDTRVSDPAKRIPSAAVLGVIRPPPAEIAARAARLTPALMQAPVREAWRDAGAIGFQTQIRTNHYLMDVSKLPPSMHLYQLALRKFQRDGAVAPDDVVADEDVRAITCCVQNLQKAHPEWAAVPLAFNGRALIYTAARLPLPVDAAGNDSITEDISMQTQPAAAGGAVRPGFRIVKYRLTLTLVDTMTNPVLASDFARTDGMEERNMAALSVALTGFARWGVVEKDPVWFLRFVSIYSPCPSNISYLSKLTILLLYHIPHSADSKNKLFHRREPTHPTNNAMLLIKRGYYVGLKQCLAGLTFVIDMNANLFLRGGPMLDILISSAGAKNAAHLEQLSAKFWNDGNDVMLDKILADIKNAKVLVLYMKQSRKARAIGPPANHKDSIFEFTDEVTSVVTKRTVAQHFEYRARIDPDTASHLPTGKLKYPGMLTINIGSTAKPAYVPPELLFVHNGQVRANAATSDIVAQIVKYTAIAPAKRFEFLANEGVGSDPATEDVSALKAIREDPTVRAFGFDGIARFPMDVPCRIQPSPMLQYRGPKAQVDPHLDGQWNIGGGMKFYKSPPGMAAGLPFAILQVARKEQDCVSYDALAHFRDDLVSTCAGFDLRLEQIGSPLSCGIVQNVIKDQLQKIKGRNGRFALVVMCDDKCYGDVKAAGDSLCLVTQCIFSRNVKRYHDKPARSLLTQLALKINTKLGGTNHTLYPRSGIAPDPASGFGINTSISWLLQEPCMLLGLDVSHAERHVDFDSIAAVVASMDPQCSQYVAQLGAQRSRQEIIEGLESMIVNLLKAFKARNGVYPKRIVAFRDGVSDGQMKEVREKEVAAIKGAFALLGFPETAVKIIFVVCQKNHHTRFFHDSVNGLVNTCPGLVVDSEITSATVPDFYLNSHVAIQGTCKATKYTLLVDEVGVTLQDIELLAYWTTYLYCRCNRSVSYATPAYYAHHASKRGATLFAAGKGRDELIDISSQFATDPRSNMFFL